MKNLTGIWKSLRQEIKLWSTNTWMMNKLCSMNNSQKLTDRTQKEQFLKLKEELNKQFLMKLRKKESKKKKIRDKLKTNTPNIHFIMDSSLCILHFNTRPDTIESALFANLHSSKINCYFWHIADMCSTLIAGPLNCREG
jgi:hypothetical protein